MRPKTKDKRQKTCLCKLQIIEWIGKLRRANSKPLTPNPQLHILLFNLLP